MFRDKNTFTINQHTIENNFISFYIKIDFEPILIFLPYLGNPFTYATEIVELSKYW